LAVDNPLNNSQTIDWMAVKIDTLPNSQLSYTPPVKTVATFRYTLRNDLFWHDGSKVTSWDAKFSLVTLRTQGSLFGAVLSPMACTDPTSCLDGVRVLSPTQFDVHVSVSGLATQAFVSSVPILPGRHWSTDISPSNCVTNWDTDANNPSFSAQQVLENCMQVGLTPLSYANCPNTLKSRNCYDPFSDSVFIGSGPWLCTAPGQRIGGGCSSSGTEIPGVGGSITLRRNSFGTSPGGSQLTYFRSSGNLALWAYSGDRGNFGTDFLNYGQVTLCFGKPVGTSGCTVWQHGIGGSAAGTIVGLSQVSIVQRFDGVNWVAPYDWIASAPQNIATFPPVLYEGA
jgi:hypothetical protein